MGGSAKIANPLGAFGQEVTSNAVCHEYVAGGTVARGDVVTITWSATTGRMTATRSATADSRALLFGVAEEAAAAGDIVKVTVFGPTFVNGAGNTFAAGEAVFRSGATVGAADRVVPDATAISGQHFAVAMGVRSATATAPYPFANAVPVFVTRF